MRAAVLKKRKLDSGLMSLAGLHQPEDWATLVGHTIDRCQEIRREILSERPGLKVLGLFDHLSDAICQVADPAEFCRSVHPKRVWREQARGACLTAGAYIANLNADKSMLSKLWDSMSDRLGQGEAWSEEAVLVGERLLVDFERGGCSLKGENVVNLWRREQEICYAFDSGLSQASAVKDMVISEEEFRSLPSHKAALFRSNGKEFLAKVPYGSLGSFTTDLPTSELRGKAYMACFQSLPQNGPVLDNLIKVRMDLARTLHHKSFAHMMLKDNIAGAPEAVIQFLESVSKYLRGFADNMSERMSVLKGGPLMPWDLWHFGHQAQKVVFADDNRFSVSKTLKGLGLIVQRAFGVIIKVVKPEEGEIWAPGVTKLVVEDEEVGILGHIYLDLFDRKDKFPGSATYTLRCGRLLPDGDYQMPVVAMAMRMGSDKISYHDLKTFLHEFGHALNAILCRTQYQTLFGTRGPLDMVEIPSHFMEFFAKEPEMLQILAGSGLNGKLRPLKDLESIVQADSLIWPLSMQEQIQWSLVDQAYFGESPCPPGGTSKVLEDIVNQHGSLPFVQGTRRELWHGHFSSYGGSYYSYIYAKCLSAMIWDKCMSGDPLSREAGEHVKRMMFMPGGAQKPQKFVTGILGDGCLRKHGNGWLPTSMVWIDNELRRIPGMSGLVKS